MTRQERNYRKIMDGKCWECDADLEEGPIRTQLCPTCLRVFEKLDDGWVLESIPLAAELQEKAQTPEGRDLVIRGTFGNKTRRQLTLADGSVPSGHLNGELIYLRGRPWNATDAVV